MIYMSLVFFFLKGGDFQDSPVPLKVVHHFVLDAKKGPLSASESLDY